MILVSYLVGEVYNEETNTWSQLAGGTPAQVPVYLSPIGAKLVPNLGE